MKPSRTPSILDFKFRKSIPSLGILESCNIEPSTIQHALTVCEYDSNYSEYIIDKKINHDIGLIEERLENTFKCVLQDMQDLITRISNTQVKKNRAQTTRKQAKLLVNIQELQKTIKIVKKRYLYFKNTYKSLKTILRLGGYRSLCICVTETLQVISSKISKFYGTSFQVTTTKKLKNFVYVKKNPDIGIASVNQSSVAKGLKLKRPDSSSKFSLGHKRTRSATSRKTSVVREDILIKIDTHTEETNKEKERSKSDQISTGSTEDSESSENSEAKLVVQEYYYQKQMEIKDSYLQEINELQSQINKLQSEMDEKLLALKNAETEALNSVTSYEDSLFTGNVSTSFCVKAYDILKDLSSKLQVTESIPDGEIFHSLHKLYEAHPNEKSDTIIASSHLGYQFDKHLKEYSKKMKVIYCAVANSKDTSIYAPMVKQMKFSASAAYHMMVEKSTAIKYGDLRADLMGNEAFVRQVWDLLEDPVTSFFATHLGFAPSIEKMKTYCEIRIPVLNSDIHNDSKNPDGKYRIRCMFISPFVHHIDYSLRLENTGRGNFSESTEPRKSKIPGISKPLNLSGYMKKQVDKTTDLLYRDRNKEYKGDTIIIHIHGGGWISQSPEQHLPYLSEWAKTSQIPAISIDYSLSPEYKYPISVNECYAVFKWLQIPENREKLGLRTDIPLHAILCGDSAGGNLSCAVTIKALQENLLPPVGLLLHYPAVYLSDSGSLSRMIFAHDPILNLETMRCVLKCYLGDDGINNTETDPLISPLVVSDEILSKFPKTVISVGDIDPLIDDATSLFSRLQENNVRTIIRVFNSLPHGFLNLPTQLPKAISAIHDASKYMKWLYEEHKKTLDE